MGIARFEKHLLKEGLARGVPPEVLFHSIRTRQILSSPLDWWARKKRAKDAQRTSKYSNFIDRAKGYRLIGPSDLPGAMEAVQAARSIYKTKKADHAKSKKPFFSNILEVTDFEKYPALMAFAQSPALAEAAASYLDTWPKLNTLGVFVSPATETTEKSQMYHVDDMDVRLVKCFINVEDVGPDNGPFTFIPADKSEEIRSQLNHRWRGPRLADEEVVAHCSPSDIVTLVGPAGTGALVDTSRCLHFGSRCRVGERVVIMINLAREPNLMTRDTAEGRDGMAVMLGGH